MDDMGYIYATLKANTKKKMLRPSASSLTTTRRRRSGANIKAAHREKL
jgi:hypothetical protein